jgi:hypothetical protein
MIVRTESRYLTACVNLPLIRAAAGGPEASCLEYEITNYYLDTPHESFADATAGSPRLRLRLYKADRFVFGQLERKRQTTSHSTEKESWSGGAIWEQLSVVLPELAGVAVREPPAGHPLRVLLRPTSPSDISPREMRWVGTLRYQRVSCASAGFRVTADSCFTPSIVSRHLMIVEGKGATTPVWQNVERAADLKPLTQSKFALLRGARI